MSTSTLSSTLAIPKTPVSLSASTSPIASREPSVEISLQSSLSKDGLDDDGLGSLPQNVRFSQHFLDMFEMLELIQKCSLVICAPTGILLGKGCHIIIKVMLTLMTKPKNYVLITDLFPKCVT